MPTITVTYWWRSSKCLENFNILNQRLKRDALHLCEPLCVLLGCVQGVDPDNNTVLLNVSAEDTCLQVDFATNSDQDILKPSRLLEVMHHQDEEGWQVRRILRTPPKQSSAQGRLSSCRCTSPCVAEDVSLLEGRISPVGEHVTVGYRVIGSLQCLSLTSLPHVSLAPGEVGFLLLDIDSLEQRTEVKWWKRKMRKKWEMTNDKYLTLTTSFPPRIAIWIAASITFRMLTLGWRPRWSSRTSEYVPLFNHLFSLSKVLCIGSTAKVKDKSDNCDESYQEVPKSRGHRQVFCSPTEKLEHIGFFAHSDDICKLTKQCLIAGWSYPD